MLVINLFGGPGVGKSSTSAGLFFKMKTNPNVGSVELVTEFAKDLVYAERFKELQPDNQLYVTAKQYNRLHRLGRSIDYVITDSPILLGLMYCGDDYFSSFTPLVWDLHNSFNSFNVVLKRVKPYNTYGRTQTEDEAKQIDVNIKRLLDKNRVRFLEVNGDLNAPDVILGMIGV